MCNSSQPAAAQLPEWNVNMLLFQFTPVVFLSGSAFIIGFVSFESETTNFLQPKPPRDPVISARKTIWHLLPVPSPLALVELHKGNPSKTVDAECLESKSKTFHFFDSLRFQSFFFVVALPRTQVDRPAYSIRSEYNNMSIAVDVCTIFDALPREGEEESKRETRECGACVSDWIEGKHNFDDSTNEQKKKKNGISSSAVRVVNTHRSKHSFFYSNVIAKWKPYPSIGLPLLPMPLPLLLVQCQHTRGLHYRWIIIFFYFALCAIAGRREEGRKLFPFEL